ncbi:MAG TPA: class I tRNA ligase family protein [Chloroflexota bacterium]|nr:class I tRNA ligase family protein [Chloroflexota bacterium]
MGNRFPPYDPASLEPGWQRRWQAQGLYRASETGDGPKFYCLDFFPYPSGESLSVGHCRNYIPTDAVSRFQRMRGRNVLHPMGWDAFGEPAELHAVSQGIHPRQTIDRNAAHYRRQLDLIADSVDWAREIDSSDPAFYRWTQWFFLLLHRRGLAYRDANWQWWCPVCQTTLSNHEAQDGVCWRGHRGLTKKRIPAWYFRITAYADELLEGLRGIDWPSSIKAMQENWIGRSEGARIRFRVESGQELPVFTTRPDTLGGVTFLALAPEHPLVDALTAPDRREEVAAYAEQAKRQSEVERMAVREKTGVRTGRRAVNPLNGAPVPLWVADYVLPTYGTGAVMGVPAHDERDRAFAEAHGLPIVEAPLVPPDVGQEQGWAEAAVSYRMRDWLISRQRYWGAPIPVVHCPEHGAQPVPEEQLPVLLPPMVDFLPDGSGRSPLARATDWVRTTCPACGEPAERETDTMGGFACSSWYFLRFTSPEADDRPFDPERVRYWMPVDLYVGGAEHAVMHLLYARFWTRVMHDAGLVPFREPFAKLRNQGQLLVRTPHRRATDPAGRETLVPATPEEAAELGPDRIVYRAGRMSKSLKNVITPDEIVERYGADALRVYELFMAPFDQDVEWSEEGIVGVRRFLRRVWDLVGQSWLPAGRNDADDGDLVRLRHRAVRRATRELEELRLNTMVAGLMELANALEERHRSGRSRTAAYQEALEALVLLLAPAAPFLAEGLWQLTGGFGRAAGSSPYAGDPEAPFGPAGSVHAQPWPTWDETLAREELVTVVVQVNGRVRDRIELPADATEVEARTSAFARPRVRALVPAPDRARVVYVPGRVLNVVSGDVLREAGREGDGLVRHRRAPS